MPCGYARVKALTDAFVRNGKEVFQFSTMVGIPAVRESIRKGVVAKIKPGESNYESLFQCAMYEYLGSCAARR